MDNAPLFLRLFTRAFSSYALNKSLRHLVHCNQVYYPYKHRSSKQQLDYTRTSRTTAAAAVVVINVKWVDPDCRFLPGPLALCARYRNTPYKYNVCSQPKDCCCDIHGRMRDMTHFVELSSYQDYAEIGSYHPSR